LEVRSTGGKTYYLKYRTPHHDLRQHKIGDAKSITFDKARQSAQKLRSIVVLGGDPAEDRKVLRAVPTLSEYVEQTYIPTIQRTRRNVSSSLSFLRRHLLPKFGSLHLDQLTSEMIREYHLVLLEKGYAPAMANKLPIMLTVIYNSAKKLKIPGTDRNPATEVKPFTLNNARERYLTPEEIKRLMDALDLSLNTQLKSIVSLLLLTGARKREILDARWEHVDFDRRTLWVPLSKIGKSRYIYLSAQAVDLIRSLPRFPQCQWMIPNPKTLLPYADAGFFVSWNNARKRAGLPEVRLHDLRHTAASVLVQANVPIFTVSRILGHTQIKTTQRYSHLAEETLLAATETASNALGILGVANSHPY
jgi:integrase